jgi:hypothetical protein
LENIISVKKLTQFTNVSSQDFFVFTTIGFLVSLIFRVDESLIYLFYISTLLWVTLLVSVFFLPLKSLIYPLIILMVSMQDITQSAEEVEEIGVKLTATPWQFVLGPLTPAFFVFLCLIICFIRLYKFPIKNPYNKLFVYFFIIATIISIHFGYIYAFNRFIADAKIPMFFCTSLVLFTSYFNRFPETFLKVSAIFFAFCIGNFLIDIIKLFFGTNQVVASVGYSNLSLDSGKGLISIISFWAIASITEGKRVLLNLAIVVLTLYVLLAFQTRWLVVTFILGILFIAIFLGFLRSTLLAFPVIIFFVISIPLMIQIAPEVWRITLLRFSFIENISSGVSLEDIELARAGSIYNSINTLSENKSFLTGMGYGSWFSDAYFPMPNLTISGFDEDSLNTGKYYRVHDFSFHFLFKFGIIGIFLYADSFLKPIISIWKKRLHYRADIFSRRISILFLGTFPMALTFMWFTGKGLMFCAFFIVLAYEWIKYFDNKFNYN